MEDIKLYLGILFIFLIIGIWQIFAVKLEVRIRYCILCIVISLNFFFVLFTELRKAGKLLLIFWLLTSGAFLFAERFPKSKRAMDNRLIRRKVISMPEDYLFIIGITMLGLELLFLTFLSSVAAPGN